MSGWIGVDLDGTLAYYDGWVDELYIGEPIGPMVTRVKTWLKDGREVRVFTARIAEDTLSLDGNKRDVARVRNAIEEWCERHIGVRLPVTNVKDYGMIELWDDRAIQVRKNTGLRIDNGE